MSNLVQLPCLRTIEHVACLVRTLDWAVVSATLTLVCTIWLNMFVVALFVSMIVHRLKILPMS